MTNEEYIQLIAEIIHSSSRWYFSLKDALSLAAKIWEGLKDKGLNHS